MSEVVEFVVARVTEKPATLTDLAINLIRLHQPDRARGGGLCRQCGLDGQTFDCTYPCDFLRAFAETYHEHPDYRREWAIPA